MEEKEKKEAEQGKDLAQNLGAAGQMLTISSSLAAGVVLGFFAGHFLDKKFGTHPWLTLLMLILGIAGGFKSVYTMIFSKKGGNE